MTTFTGKDFDIYSGERGDVIDRLDGIWIEADQDTQKWRGTLDAALDYIGFKN